MYLVACFFAGFGLGALFVALAAAVGAGERTPVEPGRHPASREKTAGHPAPRRSGSGGPLTDSPLTMDDETWAALNRDYGTDPKDVA